MVAPPASRARAASVDGEALARVAAGDTSAIAGVYDRYAGAVLAFVRQRPDGDDAEDVVHTVFMRAIRMARSYDDRGPTARAWLIGIACRVLQERRRSVFRMLRALVRFSASDGQPDAVPPPGDHRDIESGLGQLSEVQRLVLHLSDVQGFTAEEIASMLNVPLGTVSSRLFHARRIVRAFLNGEKS